MKAEEAIVILVTASSEEEAGKIARVLVEERLAACCNIIPGVRSVYRWEENICDDPEFMMIVKSRSGLFFQIEQRVRELHSYKVPEIIALPVSAGSDPYLHWLYGQIR